VCFVWRNDHLHLYLKSQWPVPHQPENCVLLSTPQNQWHQARFAWVGIQNCCKDACEGYPTYYEARIGCRTSYMWPSRLMMVVIDDKASIQLVQVVLVLPLSVSVAKCGVSHDTLYRTVQNWSKVRIGVALCHLQNIRTSCTSQTSMGRTFQPNSRSNIGLSTILVEHPWQLP